MEGEAQPEWSRQEAWAVNDRERRLRSHPSCLCKQECWSQGQSRCLVVT